MMYLFSGEYPWQVAILKKEQYDNVYVCGGSLIDGTHLLTAAHCIAQYRWVAYIEKLFFQQNFHLIRTKQSLFVSLNTMLTFFCNKKLSRVTHYI